MNTEQDLQYIIEKLKLEIIRLKRFSISPPAEKITRTAPVINPPNFAYWGIIE